MTLLYLSDMLKYTVTKLCSTVWLLQNVFLLLNHKTKRAGERENVRKTLIWHRKVRGHILTKIDRLPTDWTVTYHDCVIIEWLAYVTVVMRTKEYALQRAMCVCVCVFTPLASIPFEATARMWFVKHHRKRELWVSWRKAKKSKEQAVNIIKVP